MAARKKWQTRNGIPGLEANHESYAAVQRHLDAQAELWKTSVMRSDRISVYVDERDGRGWQLHEHHDLAERARIKNL